MRIADFYELAAVFREDDFIHGAAALFRQLQYTEQSECKSRSVDVKRWIYNLLGYDVSISLEELAAIEQIKVAGELSTIHFNPDESIRLFAIELQPWARRSQVAYLIHKLFAKSVGDCSTILFCQERQGERSCMFSIDTGDILILSDWMTEKSEVESLQAIQAAYLSDQDARSFQWDMAREIGRSYYWASQTPALIFYDLLQYASRAYEKEDGSYDWLALHDDVEKLYFQPMREYGDDYIEPLVGDGKGDSADIDISNDVILAALEDESGDIESDDENVIPDDDNLNVKEEDDVDALIAQLGDDFDNPDVLIKALETLNSPQPTKMNHLEKSAEAKEEATPRKVYTEASTEIIDKVHQIKELEEETSGKLSTSDSNDTNDTMPLTDSFDNPVDEGLTEPEEEDTVHTVEVAQEIQGQEELEKKLASIKTEMAKVQAEVQVHRNELHVLRSKKPKRAFGFRRTMKKWYQNLWKKDYEQQQIQQQLGKQLEGEIEALRTKLTELEQEYERYQNLLK